MHHNRQRDLDGALPPALSSHNIARHTLLTAALLVLASLGASATSFTNLGAGVTGVHHGSGLWGDYNGDGWLDIFVTGETAPVLGLFADIYKNNTGTTFTAQGTGLPGIASGSERSRSAWGDFDNDNDLDLIVTGVSGTGQITNLYKNTGGTFSLVTITPSPIPPLAFSSMAWGDYDNDGDLDLFIEGLISSGNNLTTIYRNDGPSGPNWQFTNVTPGFPRLMAGDGAWGDYDNDGDMDLVVSGNTGILSTPITRLYKNNGGVMVNSGVTLPQVGQSSVCWGDFNNDGNLDLVLQGQQFPSTLVLKIYLNNGVGGFTAGAWAPGFGLFNGSLACGDYNNDGNMDLLATGNSTVFGTNPITKAYFGNGLGGFTEDLTSGLPDVYEGQAMFGDYDSDGRLDILLTGLDNANTAHADVFQNTVPALAANNAPTAPVSPFVSAVSWHSITISWGAGTDVETPVASLHYNLVVKDITSGTVIVATPMADLTSGKRWLAALGNTNHNLSWTINGLQPNHTYTYCVQTIDGAWAPSAWACGSSVTTPTIGPNLTIRDCTGDTGVEPSTGICGSVMWNSPDIYVRNTNDGIVNQVHQSPQSGVTNYVYVRIKNTGTTSYSGPGRIYVYFAKASTGLTWQTHWVNNYVGLVAYGDYIGYADVGPLTVGATTIVEIPWVNVPDPADYSDPDAHHFCLAARFVAPSDPMNVLEGSSIYDNTKNNNNIAWKNVTILDHLGPRAPIGVYNTSAARVNARLRFLVPEDEIDDPVIDHVKLKVELGDELFRLWREGGQQGLGQGIELVDQQDPTNTAIWVTTADAEIRDIVLDEDAQHTMHVEVVYPAKPNKDIAGRTYHWDIIQYEDQRDEPVGGERYDILMPREANGENPAKKPATGTGNTLGQMLKLEARPNPTSSTTMLGYTMPTAGRVTIAIHDISGRLVRELAAGVEATAGTHEMAWDGTNADGTRVPAGTYFYRVTTPMGTAQKQLRVVR